MSYMSHLRSHLAHITTHLHCGKGTGLEVSEGLANFITELLPGHIGSTWALTSPQSLGDFLFLLRLL
jgi:hypothetical protein